jgi:hypothetical protein
MQKFGRKYQLNAETIDGNTLTIEPPFTIEFDITRNVLSSANTSSIRVYNLSKNHRNALRKNVNDYGDLRLISLRAGYGTNLPLIFAGNVTHAFSVREGVNFITQFESFDGGYAFANGFTAENFPAGTPQETIVQTLMDNLSAQGVQFGALGAINGTLGRGNAYSGPTLDLLRQLTGGTVFIDNGKVFVLGDNECLPARGISVINSQSGLLNTPVLEQTILHFDMIFEPRLNIGQIVTLDALNPAVPNGDYKVVSLKHRGMISEAVCGEAITTVGLFAPLAGANLSIVPGAA